MRELRLTSLLLAIFFSLPSSLSAQDAWRVVASEIPEGHRPLPFARAIGIPATATYKGEVRKVFVIIHGTEKRARASLPANVHLSQPGIEVHIDGLDQLLPEGKVELFDGSSEDDDSQEIRIFTVSIMRGGQEFRAKASVNRYLGNYSDSIVGPDGNVLGTGPLLYGPGRTTWMQMLGEMSNGFDKGRILIGGKALSPNIEIEFSGRGIVPLLKELLRVCYL